jgi:hypothetical protein
MLAQTIVLVALCAIFAASAVAQIAGFARGQTADAAKALMQPAIETALGRYQRALGTTIAAGSTQWAGQRYLLVLPGTPLAAAVDVTPTAQTSPVCGAPGNAGPDRAVNDQCSPLVQESRLSLAVTTDVGPPDGAGNVTPLAHGRYAVTLRLFAQPPYSMVSGVKDAADPSGAHEGDTGGWSGALPAFASPAPDDTTIHVVYRCTDGLGSCALSNPPPPDLPQTLPWTDGNGVP